MYILGWRIGSDPTDFLYAFFHSETAAEGQNYPGYSNSSFDAIIDEARETGDEDARLKLIQDAQAAIAYDLPYDVLYFRTNNVARWGISSAGAYYPVANVTYDIGLTTNRARHVYCGDTARPLEEDTSVVAYKTSAQVIAHATWTNILFNAEIRDPYGFHSVAVNTDRLTIPAGMGGAYVCWANFGWSDVNAVGSRHLSITRNGAGIIRVITDPVGAANVRQPIYVGPTYVMNAGDYFTLRFYQTSGGNISAYTAENLIRFNRTDGYFSTFNLCLLRYNVNS